MDIDIDKLVKKIKIQQDLDIQGFVDLKLIRAYVKNLESERNEALTASSQAVSKFLEGVKVNENLYGALKKSEQEAEDFRIELVELRAKLAAMESQEPAVFIGAHMKAQYNPNYDGPFGGGFYASPIPPVPSDKPAVAVPEGALAMLNQIIAALEGGFVACQRCGDQEDTASLDCMYELKKLRNLLAAAPSHSQKSAVVVPDGFALVPIERSYDMRTAAFLHYNTAKQNGKDHDDSLDAAWRATIEKAHSPELSDHCPSHESEQSPAPDSEGE